MMYRILLFMLYLSSITLANEKVVLQLKWLHQFQFAGYYAAKEKGFYKELGLDVEIRQRDINQNNIKQVISGEAQYGVADSVLFLYKSKKEPLVIVSPIFQHSPSVLLTLKNSGINSAYSLDNKDMTFYKNNTDGFSIYAMLKKLNVEPNFIRQKSKDDYKKLINGEIEVFPAYISNEPYYFKEKDIDINIINPTSYGFDLYGDMLFTNENEARNHPQRVRKFKEATLRGWEYALDNKEEIISLINEKYNSSKSIGHLKFEANAIDRIINKDTIPLGNLDKGRMQYISSLYKEHGFLEEDIVLKEFIFDEYTLDKKDLGLSLEEKKYLQDNLRLKVPNLGTFPPFNYNENGKPLGYSIEYVKLMAKYLGVKLEIIENKTWKEYISMLESGELHFIPHIAYNKERSKSIDFTNFIHLNFHTGAVVRKDLNITNMKDFSDKVLAVQSKTFQHTFIKNRYPNQKLYLTSSSEDGVTAVSEGKADFALGNIPSFDYYIQKDWLTNLKTIRIKDLGLPAQTNLLMGVKKGNTVLKSILEKVNDAIPKNEINKLRDEWMNVNLVDMVRTSFDTKELVYLTKKEKLKMCIDPSWMPFEKIEDGVHSGITSDYIKIFKEQLPIPIKLIKTDNWLQTVDFAKSRKCDFITSMSETNERKEYFNFTNSLMKVPIVIATKLDKPFINTISDIKAKRIGIVKGFGYINKIKEQYPNIDIVEVNGAKDGLNRVSQGEIYGFIGVLQAVGYNIQKNYFDDLKIAGKLNDSWSFPMATRNDEPYLNSIFNKLISNISDETHSNILNRWISVKFEESVDYTKLVWIFVVFFIIFLIIIHNNRSIKEINTKMKKYLDLVDENVLTSTTDKHGTIINVSQAFCDISGYTKDELLGQNHRIIRHPDMEKKVFENLWKTISSAKVWKGELKNRKKDGGFYWVDATITPNLDELGRVASYTAIRHEITDKKKIEEISIRDELTTLYNKRYFNEMFEKEINRAKRDEHLFAFMIFDIDHFKQYNDNYGHQKGDEVLELVGKTIKKYCKRSSDIPFRIGGEEFGIVFTPHFKEIANDFSKNMCHAIENLKIEHKFSSASSYVTVSIGLYVARAENIKSSKEIYKLTDDALYLAKAEGRNQVKSV